MSGRFVPRAARVPWVGVHLGRRALQRQAARGAESARRLVIFGFQLALDLAGPFGNPRVGVVAEARDDDRKHRAGALLGAYARRDDLLAEGDKRAVRALADASNRRSRTSSRGRVSAKNSFTRGPCQEPQSSVY